jgi:hypothetical protein
MLASGFTELIQWWKQVRKYMCNITALVHLHLHYALITYLKWWRNIEILINWERHLVVNVVYQFVSLGAYCSHGIVHGDLMMAVASKHSPCVMGGLWVHKDITCWSAYVIHLSVKIMNLFVAANENCYMAIFFIALLNSCWDWWTHAITFHQQW